MKDFGPREARKLLPKRSRHSNKATAGKSLIVAGSQGMFGAAVLCATAASRVGSGYVTLLSRNFPSTKHPDFLSDESKNLSKTKFNAAAIGPGLGQSLASFKILKKLLKLKAEKVVIDADGLNLAAKHQLLPFPKTWIATPHEGELARLLKIPAAKIRNNREAHARLAQRKLNCIVVLKGFETLIATPNSIFKIRSGNPSLAKAGTGDVLTGLICGFLAQGLEPENAACLGVFLHGYLADLWVKKNDPLSLMPSDLLELLPSAIKKLRIKKEGAR